MPKAKVYVAPEDRPLPLPGQVAIRMVKPVEAKRMKGNWGERDSFIFRFEITHYKQVKGGKATWLQFSSVEGAENNEIDVITRQEYGADLAAFTILIDAMLPGLGREFMEVMEGDTDVLTGWNGTGVIKINSEGGKDYANLSVTGPSDGWLGKFAAELERLKTDPFGDDTSPDEMGDLSTGANSTVRELETPTPDEAAAIEAKSDARGTEPETPPVDDEPSPFDTPSETKRDTAKYRQPGPQTIRNARKEVLS